MIKLNLLDKNNGLALPKFLGVDLNKINLKNVIIAIIIIYSPEYIIDFAYNSKIESLTNQRNEIENENNNLKSEIDSQQDVKVQLEKFKEQVENLESRSRQVDQLLEIKKNPRKVLEKIARSIPEDAWIDRMIINSNDELSIFGGSYTAKSIGEFITISNDSPYFGGSLTPSQQESRKGILDGVTANYEYYEIRGQILNYDMQGGAE